MFSATFSTLCDFEWFDSILYNESLLMFMILNWGPISFEDYGLSRPGLAIVGDRADSFFM